MSKVKNQKSFNRGRKIIIDITIAVRVLDDSTGIYNTECLSRRRFHKDQFSEEGEEEIHCGVSAHEVEGNLRPVVFYYEDTGEEFEEGPELCMRKYQT